MTRTRATACAVALLLSGTTATAANVPSPVPQTDFFDNYLPVPEHSIEQACGSLKYRDEITQCIRYEEMQHRYVTATWGALSIKEQKEAVDLVSAKATDYHGFYRDLANYIEVKRRQRQHLD
jgi:hypothetical protein